MESLVVPRIARPLPSTYTRHPFAYRRRRTRVVHVGDVAIGGSNPIRIQSMTTTDTLDTAATVRQVLSLVDAGCEIVRITAPSIRDAENLKNIHDALRQQNVRVPLVADIHFTPNAALKAADIVEKVRINPGNFADKKKFAVVEYSDAEYERELERIEETFKPLVLRCKANGVAMRIGTNHGSLSDRIMNRFGDTPEGMVESALEFVRICERYDFHDIVLSMKSSNPQVMIAAYRLLAARMDQEGMEYPFHLGVTEAGDGDDGRIKSAIGIGSLLEDGIGDTIRVSLTEDPEAEISPARTIASKYDAWMQTATEEPAVADPDWRQPFAPYTRRWTQTVEMPGINLGGVHHVRVHLPLHTPLTNLAGAIDEYRSLIKRATPDDPHAEVVEICVTADILPSWKTFISSLPERGPLAVDVGDDTRLAIEILPDCDAILFRPSSKWNESEWTSRLAILVDAIASEEKKALVIDVNADHAPSFLAHRHSIDTVCAMAERTSSFLLERNFKNFCLRLSHPDLVHAARAVISRLESSRFTVPLQVSWTPAGDEPALFYASTALGSLLCDGIGDAITVDDPNVRGTDAVRLCFNILQATRLRISKTEFISCPSCGRTLFDLQEVTARIKSKTGHLKGVKIAIMGCIVNGPGEMADADFGYVGAAAGKINLYVGKELVERNIDMAIADERLIDLIRRKGMWVDAVETAKS